MLRITLKRDNRRLDQIGLEDLIAPLVVVDIQEACSANPDYRLTLEDLESWEEQHGPIPSGSVVFALTGWGQYWDDYDRYKNQDDSGQLHFPGFSEEAALFLVEAREIKGIGIDTLSVDYGLSTGFFNPSHRQRSCRVSHRKCGQPGQGPSLESLGHDCSRQD